jgi:glycosyltransferase involved in cell wall biosynthesis
MSKISIALCTYNGAKFLPAQLESFLAQTRLPDELIVCDDCSTDETPQMINDFARRAPFTVTFRINEKNLGSTKNFERAISLCGGDLIFLSDQDDVWLPKKIARIETEFVKNSQVGLVFSDAEIVDENLQTANCNLWQFTFSEERRENARNGKFFDVLLRQNVVTGATMAFRSGYRKSFMPIPDRIPNLIHDAWISLLIASEAKVVFVEEQLIKYRQHSGQQLGIDYESASKKSFLERKERYAEGIEFSRQEVERLEQTKEMFAAYPHFEKKRNSVSFKDLIEEKREQIAHYDARMNLPFTKIERFLPVCRETLTGRYHRFSKGFLSVAKDLLENW